MGIILFVTQIRQASFQEVSTMNKVPWLVGAGVGIEARGIGHQSWYLSSYTRPPSDSSFSGILRSKHGVSAVLSGTV